MEFFFMFIGFGFFLFVMQIVERGEERRYHRRLNEQREFGYQIPKEKK